MLPSIKSALGRLAAHQGFRRYFANTAWMFSEQILRMIAGLLVGIWVARYLGPEQFGVFNYAVAFVALFATIAKLGLDSIVVRDLVHDPEKRDVYLGTAFWLKVAGAVVTIGLVLIAASFTASGRATRLYILIIAAGLLFQSFEVIDFYFQSKVLSKYVSICKIAQLVLSSALKLYFIFSRAELFWFVLVSLVDQASLGLALFFAYRSQKLENYFRHFDPALAKRLLRDSWPLIFSSVVIMIYMRIDQVMIKEMLGAKEVGLFSAAVRLSEVWYFIPMVITSSIFPAIVNAKKTSEALYVARLQRLYAFMVWLSIAIALPMTFASTWLVKLLYGAQYAAAGQVLMIHIWAGLFVFLGVASGSWLISENLQRIAFYRTLMGALLNVALNLVLIPRHGVLGAAIATVIAQAMAALVFDLTTRVTRPMFFMKLKAFNPANLFRGGM